MKIRAYLRVPSHMLYLNARLACQEVEQTAAELVIACHPAGYGMLHAARAVWEASHTTPFPPVAVIGFGSEKEAAYAPVRREFGEIDSRGPAVIQGLYGGHRLAWIARQAQWQAELATAIETQAGLTGAPRSAVVLSDFAWGTVGELVLALLDDLYPGIHARAVIGPPGVDEWHVPFTYAWLNRQVPEIFRQGGGPPPDPEASQRVAEALFRVALGWDLPDPQSLHLRAMDAEHPDVVQLTDALSLDGCLALPEGVLDELRQSVLYLHRVWTRGKWSHRYAKMGRWSRSASITLQPLAKLGKALWLRRRLTADKAAEASGLPVEDTAIILEELLQPGVIEVEEAGGERVYCLHSDTGVLAYGALLAEPGPELAAFIEQRTPVRTPFPVEYMRSSATRAGAPVLVPVPEGYGATVPAEVWTLSPEVDRTLAETLLYRRELDLPGEPYVLYSPEAAAGDGLGIEALEDFADLPVVLYAAPMPNLPEVIPPDVPMSDKAAFLARHAIASVTRETHAAGHDGIAGLAAALAQGAVTALTRPYCDAVLALTSAGDLAAARERALAGAGL
jgi:hypothetical protein